MEFILIIIGLNTAAKYKLFTQQIFHTDEKMS